MAYTITHSKKVKGFPSFYSYHPEMMVGMNNHFFSFKNGNLYRHNATKRLEFYGENYRASIKGVLNNSPTEQKTFKTISLNASNAWRASLYTDLSEGYIDEGWYEEKEGKQHAYIRNSGAPSNKKRSVSGIGSSTLIEQVAGVSNTYLITFPFNIGTIVSSGDELFTITDDGEEKNGYVIDRNGKTLTVECFGFGEGNFPVPEVSKYTFVKKSTVAEAYGLTGYYLSYELSTGNVGPAELFGVDSNVFKSYA